MTHKNWCGEPCHLCETSCWVDESIPCSPDCEYLSADGEPNNDYCLQCDAINFELPTLIEVGDSCLR